MSVESAKAFMERMKKDADFAKDVAACKDSKARLDFAKAQGFDFTPKDIRGVCGEISEDDLAKVAGGYCLDAPCLHPI
jgi:predicted ribosomally synthesized peptide with nif11-like leader